MDARAAGVCMSCAIRAARAAFASQYSALWSGIGPDYRETRARTMRALRVKDPAAVLQ